MSDYSDGYVPPRRWRRRDLLMLGLSLAHGVSATITDVLASAVMLTAAHSNYEVEREMFREEAALEIETITGEQE